MSEPAIPREALALVHGPAASMAHVEALLVLRGAEPSERALGAIAAAAHIPALALARRCLEELVSGGLVARVAADVYRYAPASAHVRHAVDALAQAYNEKPVTLVRALYSRPASPVQSFADAFRLRDDGEPR